MDTSIFYMFRYSHDNHLTITSHCIDIYLLQRQVEQFVQMMILKKVGNLVLRRLLQSEM